jgi:Alanine racemase, N-terminal domain
MTFSLYVDGPRWRAHADSVLAQTPGLVPVIKGNGYGYGRGLLAAEAARLGVDTVAVGEPEEVASVRAGYSGDIMVLSPYLPGIDGPVGPDDRVIRTVATLDGLEALAGHRVVIEVLTSMQRFGFAESELSGLAGSELSGFAESELSGFAEPLGSVRHDGFALHLPLERGDRTRVAETGRAVTRLRQAGLTVHTIWVSHLSGAELTEVGAAYPDISFRSRVGTRLWLGDRGASQARATVLAVHALRKGDRYGYRQRRAPRTGHLIVVGGGTSHGVALSAPSPAGGLTQRAKTVAIGGLEAIGRSLSPFYVDGAQRWFAEPPHMQVSMLWLPDGVAVPAVGDELDTDVRMTTTAFDQVVVSP